MATMKAVEIKDGKGPATSLFINASTPKPSPAAGEALVRVRAFGLNRMDLIQREGHYPLPPQAPSTLGVEFSGVVESLGEGAAGDGGDEDDTFRPGDEVFGLAYGGAYAEFVAVSTRMLLRKPGHLSFEAAAGVPETFMTATQALHLVGEFAAGKRVLWHAGASGVSIAGIQLSRRAGASEVYATAGSPEKCRLVEEELGADHCADYRARPDWDEEILRRTGGRGVDLIVDFVGASYFARNLKVAARDARWVVLGTLGGMVIPPPGEDPITIAPLLFKRVRIEGSTLRSRDLEYQGRLRDRMAAYVPDFESGALKVRVDTVMPMEDIVKAHQLLEANTTTGKIICTVA